MLGILWEEFLRQPIWDDCSIVYLGYQHFYDYKYIIDRAKDNIHPIMIFPCSFHLFNDNLRSREQEERITRNSAPMSSQNKIKNDPLNFLLMYYNYVGNVIGMDLPTRS